MLLNDKCVCRTSENCKVTRPAGQTQYLNVSVPCVYEMDWPLTIFGLFLLYSPFTLQDNVYYSCRIIQRLYDQMDKALQQLVHSGIEIFLNIDKVIVNL